MWQPQHITNATLRVQIYLTFHTLTSNGYRFFTVQHCMNLTKELAEQIHTSATRYLIARREFSPEHMQGGKMVSRTKQSKCQQEIFATALHIMCHTDGVLHERSDIRPSFWWVVPWVHGAVSIKQQGFYELFVNILPLTHYKYLQIISSFFMNRKL